MLVKICDNEYTLIKPKLKSWIELEQIRSKITQSIEEKDVGSFCSYVLQYVGESLHIDIDTIRECPWTDIVIAFQMCVKINVPDSKFPIFKVKSINNKKEVWEYEGRSWYFWSCMFAKSFGWSMEYIAELPIDDAVGLLQEIYIDDQLEKEFEWMMSEIAYPYNSASKRSEFKPLPRPGWMSDEVRVMSRMGNSLPKVKILKSMLPVGNVIHANPKENDAVH